MLLCGKGVGTPFLLDSQHYSHHQPQAMNQHRQPLVAIVDNNMFAALGLKGILQSVMPIMQVETFLSFEELSHADPERFYHYFVAVNIVLDHRSFFIENKRKTIVLTTSSNPNAQLTEFHCLCVNQPEQPLAKSLLSLAHGAHANGRNLPPQSITAHADHLLSDREIEVMTLIVKGYINKEIADRLNIGLATVITHRRNILEKLNIKSVSALTIYAVTHGYVDIHSI